MSKKTNTVATQAKGMTKGATELAKAYNGQVATRIKYEADTHNKGVESKVFYDLSAGDKYFAQAKTTDFAARVLTDINVGFINERERDNSRTYAKAVPMFGRIASALALGAEPSKADDVNQQWFGKVLGGNAFMMLIGAFWLHHKHGINTLNRDDLIAMQSMKAETGLKTKLKQAYRGEYGLGTASSHASMFAIAMRALGLAETVLDTDGKKVKTLKINFDHKALKWLVKYAPMIEKGKLPQKLDAGTTTASIVAKAA